MASKQKITVGILFGGKSAEHEVSLQSAKNVVDAIDRNKYDIVLIGIDKEGQWLLQEESNFLLNAEDPKLVKLNASNASITLAPEGEGSLVATTGNVDSKNIDVIFPILHGPMGEDGTVQGFLKLADIPFVGCDVLGAAVGMDKEIMKRLLRDAGLPIGRFATFHAHETIDFDMVKEELGMPLFVKPANLGSSVGINKAHNVGELKKACEEAFRYDSKILIEEFIEGREIECAVIGNEDPKASLPGEIVVHDEFYSYDTKYVSEDGASLAIPADLPEEVVKEIQALALLTFTTLAASGLARVDFFVTKKNEIFVNEINTMPGFTKNSMYPKLWEASGISYSELIDRLIELARERHAMIKKHTKS